MQKDPTNKDTRDHEETSSKTLHDIEEDEKTADVENDSAATPSPDGGFDESNENEDAGPM
jgi:hypothetical protein